MSKNYKAAVAFAESRLRHLVQDGKLRAIEMHPNEVFFTICFGIRNGSDEKGVFYLCGDDALTWLTIHAEKDRGIYDLACKLIATRIMRGEGLPEQSRMFAGLRVGGKIVAPKEQVMRSKTFTDNLMLYWTAKLIELDFRLTLTRSDSAPAISACDAVSDGLKLAGHSKSFRAIKDLCYHDSALPMRQMAHQIHGIIKKNGSNDPELAAYWQSQAPWKA